MRLAATGSRTRRMLGLLLVAAGPLLPAMVAGKTLQTAAAKSDSIPFEPDTFARELSALRDSIAGKELTPQREAAIGESLPATWKIHTPDGDYDVPTAPLRKLLDCTKCDSARQKEHLDEARSWVGALAAQAKGYATPASSENVRRCPPEARLDSGAARIRGRPAAKSN